MSRLAKRPVQLPSGVEAQVKEGTVSIKGPKGKIETNYPDGITLEHKDQSILVQIDEKKLKRPFLGLYHSLIKNGIEGVTNGFQKKLTLIGVGFRAALKGNKLDLQLGFSHPCELDIPEGVQVAVEKGTSITLTGVDKQVVGQFAANIRSLRPPEPYKGKGVRYEDEYVRRKAGKTAKGK